MLKSKLCIQCGVERPLDDFNKKSNGHYAKTCNHTHQPTSTKKSRYHSDEAKLKRRSSRATRNLVEQKEYDRARQRGPRRITQMKASRLPLGTPSGMTRNDYAIYLTSPHWLKFRNEYRETVDFCCFICGEAADDIHHTTYVRIGCERFDDVVPLCRKDHELAHELVKSGVALDRAHVVLAKRQD